MTNPYRNRPPYTFWKSGIVDCLGDGVDPVVAAPFTISRSDAVATAGSCFAQHISRALVQQGFSYFVAEAYHGCAGTLDENYGTFSARFGNIYTSRQLVQLFDTAYGLRRSKIEWWRGKSGEIIDPFRPRIQTGGFPSVELLRADRVRHLAAVQKMFEQCQVFVFTLGLTETWVSTVDGSAFPLAPGVVSPETPGDEAEFHNFGVTEVTEDLRQFLEKFWTVNADARVILTVSPVPLIATYEDRHVLVSTIASKSILRAAADEICRKYSLVTYFPSYEIITGPQAAPQNYAADRREVTADGVANVMSLFAKHYLQSAAAPLAAMGYATAPDPDAAGQPPPVAGEALAIPEAPASLTKDDMARMAAVAEIICDEEAMIS